MKKLNLSVSGPLDCNGFAIVSPEKDYRLCFEINKTLGYTLEKSKILKINNLKTNSINDFSAFYYFDEDNKYSHYIIKNLQENTRLMPQVKEADYIYLISGKIKEKTLQEIKAAFAAINNIESIFVLKNDYIKHINLD